MSERFSEQLSRLSVSVYCEMDHETQSLIRHLQLSRATVRQFWPTPDRIGEDCDVVIASFHKNLAQQLAWIPGEPKAALILVLPASGTQDMGAFRATAADAVIHRPFQPHTIDAALFLGLDHFLYGKRLRGRVGRLEENIRSLRDIERAKQVIMAKHSIDEHAAYRQLRSLAMDKRLSIAELATKMIDS